MSLLTNFTALNQSVDYFLKAGDAITVDAVSAPAGESLALTGKGTTVVIGENDAVSGGAIAWNTISAGQGNLEIMVGKGTGVGNIDFFAGLTNGAVPAAGSQELRITPVGIETPQLTLAGAVFTNPKPRFFNWSASNPGGSMVLPSLGTLDVTLNATVNAANLYRITFEVYMVQTTAGTGEVAIYADSSPLVYADVIPTTAITPALDFRRSYCMICDPSDSTLKIVVNNTSNQQVNITWLPILLEDLGPQPTAPTG
jgi:hypothetical protein